MRIAVLSGKGGTGKTTVSVNMAYCAPEFRLIDADIEEPNSHLFINPDYIFGNKRVFAEYPVINSEKCTLCGKCGDFCKFNAIIAGKKGVVIFKESCHCCGGCEIVCPENAITYEKREIGRVIKGRGANKVNLEYGVLNIGELSGVKIINELKKGIKKDENIIIDSPPGAACAVAATIEDIDYALLVTEPTPFGVSDMKIVEELLREEGIKFGMVINKAGIGNSEIYDYCKEKNINIVGEIPFDIEIAKMYSSGRILSEKKEYREMFKKIVEKIKKEVENNG
jgi:MinD superfamily P-loop ATPase